MNRRVENGVMAAVVAVGAIAGIAIAGVPQLGSADPVRVETAPSDTSAPTVIGATPTSDPETIEPATTSTTRATTTTTEPPVIIRPVEEVLVVVANGTSVPGAAARLTTTVAQIGHPTLQPRDTRAFPNSEIWHAEGYEPEALNLAAILGVFPDRVLPIPPDPGLDTEDAALVVIVGPELADPN